MPYIEDRIVHDADSHVMEIPGWLDEFGTRAVRDAFNARFGKGHRGGLDRAIGQQDDPAFRAGDAAEIMARKNHDATGAFRREDRPLALDLMGIASQLVFPTSTNVWLEELEHGDDLELLYDTASATNRAQTEFCAVDVRLRPVCYVPLASLERAPAAARKALDAGAAALLVPWACPKEHATSHIALDALWGLAAEARVPILFHVGVADRVLPRAHKNNGLPPVPDFHGGEENFRSVSYMAIPHGPMQALSMLILDGVLERFESLRIGVIELGASWLPGFMRQLDSAGEAFARHEARLASLTLRPGEYVERQVRVTPYPTEPAGWIIGQSAPGICMFSSDFPHVEGGRNPYGRFRRTTAELSVDDQDRFFRGNFEDLMGTA
ncbi:MAG: amidohydrolase family protein [Gammaproteobacteria bacterium]|nr:amidohydrolase family protein [Gammaproteobacteria bacterium]